METIMEKTLEPALLSCPLFRGIRAEELGTMLDCLGAVSVRYRKGQTIWQEGRAVHQVGVICSGRVLILREDFWGDRSIQGQAGPGDLFGEAYACGDEPLGVTVQAAEDSQILFLDTERVLGTCSSACPFHLRLVRDLVDVLAAKDRMLSRKIDHLSQRGIRRKVLSYLSWQARQAGDSRFTIPFDRQGMADYLSVDRSALSQELSRMKREGLLDFYKNQFQLKGNGT